MTRLEVPDPQLVSEPVPEVPPPGTGSRASGTSAVTIDAVTKVYGVVGDAVPALDHISLDVAPGQFVCLLGASGCGKSTLLNLVAGLDRPTAGTVTVQGRTTLMFQEAALLSLIHISEPTRPY